MRLSAEKDQAIQQETGQLSGTQAGVLQSGLHVKGHGGFSLIELIMVLVIVGIVAVVAIPRAFDRTSFDSRAFYDRTISTLRYAQKTAVAQHTTVCVVDTATEIGLFAADCTTPLNVMTSQQCASEINKPYYQHKVCAPTGVTLYSFPVGSLSFTALGRTPAKKTYTVGGLPPITVEAETGYVH